MSLAYEPDTGATSIPCADAAAPHPPTLSAALKAKAQALGESIIWKLLSCVVVCITLRALPIHSFPLVSCYGTNRRISWNFFSWCVLLL